MIPKNKIISILHPSINTKGGAVKMMIYLSNLLKKEGNKVTFYTLSYNKELYSKEIDFDVVVSTKISIAKKIRNSDYVFIGNSPMQFVGVVSKLLFFSNAKLIWWHHHYPWYYSENTNFLLLMKRYIEKFSIKFIDTIVVNSNYLKESVDKIYSVNSKVLYPIVDDEFTNNKLQSKSNIKRIIFSYGRWEKGKNLKQIFDTYLYLVSKNLEFDLLIGGVGTELDFYHEKFKTDNKISFLGLLDKQSIINNLKRSNILLFPSLIDSFGMTILEAQLFGVPVIAFDLNGAREIIINGKTGFLVEDEKDFNEKTLLLLLNESILNSFSKDSILLKNKFCKNNFIEQLKCVF